MESLGPAIPKKPGQPHRTVIRRGRGQAPTKALPRWLQAQRKTVLMNSVMRNLANQRHDEDEDEAKDDDKAKTDDDKQAKIDDDKKSEVDDEEAKMNDGKQDKSDDDKQDKPDDGKQDKSGDDKHDKPDDAPQISSTHKLIDEHNKAEAALKKEQERLKLDQEARVKQRLAWRRAQRKIRIAQTITKRGQVAPMQKTVEDDTDQLTDEQIYVSVMCHTFLSWLVINQ